MDKKSHEEIRDEVRRRYGEVAASNGAGCGCGSSCCGASPKAEADDMSRRVGYSQEELAGVPEGANLGLGCGNPGAIASLKPGETVLDLGSGGGFDCFLAAQAVGDAGHVIGVDMTAEMISQSRRNAEGAGMPNVEFRLGEMENRPVADSVIDVILSNCVINLSPEKERVFREAFRVLKPGGRLAISDVVAMGELPQAFKDDPAFHTGCIAGAASVDSLRSMLRAAGFAAIQICPKPESRAFLRDWMPGSGAEALVVSATITATKPTP